MIPLTCWSIMIHRLLRSNGRTVRLTLQLYTAQEREQSSGGGLFLLSVCYPCGLFRCHRDGYFHEYYEYERTTQRRKRYSKYIRQYSIFADNLILPVATTQDQ